MSCQLSVLSKFHDISAVKRCFFPSSKEGTPIRDVLISTHSNTLVHGAAHHRLDAHNDEDADNWDQDWGFDDQETTREEELENIDAGGNERDHKKDWLQSCLVSLSPTNDVFVIAQEHKICVLTQKWDPKKKGEEIDSNLTTIWEATLGADERETITAVLCLPLASQKRSTPGGPDWTCIIVGFSSGYVRMYTQNGVLLLSQLLHMERIEKLKCRTYSPPRFLGMAETHDELLIMYTKAIVSIDGFSLIQSLRACCNQVARATASGTENMLQPPPLAYKKWSLGSQEKVSDYVSCGLVCANPFDQLKAASLLGGVNATVKTSPPAMSVFMTAGTDPYVGFFYAIEGFTQPILSEVAIAMANKIKSALITAASGWLGFGTKGKEEKEKVPKIESAVLLPLRFGLPDKRRLGEIIILSSCNNYAATTDSFGRVILIDIQRGMAVRMWKGYRDAQLGWVEVKEESVEPGRNSDHYRIAQFLIIYAPRRGILEVWLSAHGPRVAAFNVSKYCRLVCPSYGMMGLNNVTCRGVKSRAFQCALIDPGGVIKTIDIPFHLALSDKSSKRARDLHLLKKLKTFLKESSEDREGLEETITELLSDMKVASIAHQAIERILSTRYLQVRLMLNVVKTAIKNLDSRAEASLDLDSKMMLRFCKTQRSLLTLFDTVTQLNSAEVEPNKLSDLQILTDVLALSHHEATAALNLLNQQNLLTRTTSAAKHVTKVSFKEDSGPLAATSFLHAFSYRTLLSNEEDPSAAPLSAKQTQITISKEATEERRQALAKFVFGGCLNNQCQSQELMSIIHGSQLPPDQLVNLLLFYWLSVNERSISTLANLYELVKSITALTDMSEVLVDPNMNSAWWQRVRTLCSQSENCRAAFLAVLACRAVAANALGIRPKAKDPDADTASTKSDENDNADTTNPADVSMDSQDWEPLSVDMESWDLLTKQFEGVMAITTLLNIPANNKVGEAVFQPISVSVSRLLNSGKGSIPEVVARFVVQQRLNPASLFNSFSLNEEQGDVKGDGDDSVRKETKTQVIDKGDEDAEPQKESELTGEEKIKEMSQAEKIKYQLEELRHRFPHSLHNDVLLANCCWEYAVVWNKDPEVTQNLESSLEFLRLVQNAVLRQGVSSLLWHMFIQKKASSAAHLMEKVGKPPKDRLCRKEVGMSDTSLVLFISLCADFMEIVMDTHDNFRGSRDHIYVNQALGWGTWYQSNRVDVQANCEANEVPVCNVEPEWQKVQGPTSLMELAVDQKVTNYGLLRVHFHLLKIMSAVLTLHMKSVKVLSLFDNKGRAAVFRELHSHPLLPNQKVDHDLFLLRRDFLCRTITSAVATIDPPNWQELNPSSMGTSPVLRHQRSHYPQAFKWPQVALTLAKDFGIDLDYIKRHHVCELYSSGHDKLAEEVMMSVNDSEEMGIQLLNLSGQRVAYEIFARNIDANFQHLAGMSTGLGRWLKSLDYKKLHFPNVPLSVTVTVLEHAASRLPETCSHHELAQELLEKTMRLQAYTDL